MQGCAYGNLILLKLKEKVVFFLYLFSAPASGPVEFSNNVAFVFKHEVIDPVLIAVQGHAVARGGQAAAFKGLDNDVRGQVVEKVAHGSINYSAADVVNNKKYV